MSRYAENQLIAHLLDEDSLDILIKQGLPDYLLPTEELRAVYDFSIDYYLNGGRLAPTEEVFDNHEISIGRTIGNLLDDLEVEWRKGAETSIDWVMQNLKSGYVSAQSQILMREAAQKNAEADDESRLEVFNAFVAEAVGLSLLLEDKRTRVDVRETIGDRLRAYEDRANGIGVDGLTMGLPELDTYTNMIQPGELAMLAAFAKVGKSYALDLIALREWQRGRVPAVFTLENFIDMTLDRLACIACGIDSTKWQTGECIDVEVDRVRDMVKQMEDTSHPFLLFSPEPGSRTPESMIRLAQISEADSIVIDQLSHIEYNGKQTHRPTQVAEIMNKLSTIIGTGHHPIPCLLAHQINREGKKSADKAGWHEMEHLAESSSAERYCSFVFSMYQSHDMYQIRQVLLQVLAARRAPIKWWDMAWRPELGYAGIRRERTPFEE